MDVTPLETRLKRNVSTQTDVDQIIYKEALNIITNFDKIERYWNRIKRQNYLLLVSVLCAGLFIWKRG